MTDYRERIRTLRERIETSAHLDPADREELLHFSDEMDFADVEYGDQRHVKLLQHCTVLAGDSPNKYDPEDLPDTRLTDAIDDREQLKKVQRWIKNNFESEETKRDYRVAVRMFAEHSTLVEEKGAADELNAGTPRNYQPMPDPTKMLYWDEHIKPMIEAATSYRDEAAIALSWDLGARPFEFEALRVGDIVDHKHGMKVSVDGKRGQRSPLIIPSVPYVKRWLNAHPAQDDPTAPLWSKLNTPEEISYRMFLKMIKKPARNAGVNHTDIHYRRMRKSSASYLASQNVNQAHLEDHHGWTRGSDVASRYVAVFGEANDREIARAHGADVDMEEPDPTAPVRCIRCNQKTPRNRDTCVWCGAAQSQKAAEEIDAQRDRAMRSIREGDEETAESVMTIEGRLSHAPGLRSLGVDE
jgi:site-specific recombinase XerC